MAQGDVQVVWNTEIRRWRVEVTGNDRATNRYATKVDAIRQARRLARQTNAELVIYERDGTISQRDSPGTDPGTTSG
jgi:hypothetical protein